MILNDVITIAVLPGDGIGLEVTEAAIPVFNSLDIPVRLEFGDIGWSCWQQEGMAIPDRTWHLIEKSDTVLLGATTSKPEREAKKERAKGVSQHSPNYVSPIIQLRQHLDLYANIRPCFNITGERPDFNCCIIRDNSEGLYAGFDYCPLPEPLQALIAEHPRWQSIKGDEASCTLRLQTKSGLLRLFACAFDYAASHGMHRVTLADKANVLRHSSNMAREIFESIASQYPHIDADIVNVDACALWLIRRPESLGVIVAENMFGDILSDVGAGVMGGLGLAPSANIGQKGCYFEPVHGSAPRIKTACANPSAMFLTIALLLEHFGYKNEANKINAAVATVIKERRDVTYDLGGHATTHKMAAAIIARLHEENVRAKAPGKGLDSASLCSRLQAFSTSEIADALDACGVEGALLSIKPLSRGHKLIGPAYTLGYVSYDKTPEDFRSAADYIDAVPPNSVLVIDNNGRTDCSVWGGILTQVALKKRIAGTIVHGAVRDVALIGELNYPLFSVGHTMRSGKNRVYKAHEQTPLRIHDVTINPGDILFADDNGVLVIPCYLVLRVIDKAQNIKQTEALIVQAVSEGSTLKEARKKYRYDIPWLAFEGDPVK